MISHQSRSIERRFLITIGLTGFILIAEVIGAWWTGSLALLSDAAHVFLDIFVEEKMRRSPGVAEVHDLHVWNLCSHHAILSAHVVLADKDASRAQNVMDELKLRLKADFGIEHTILQMELECCKKDSICTY